MLSRQCADHVHQCLTTEALQLGPQLKAAVMWFCPNVIGSDNALDAFDRRGEFKIVACG